jgi:hypothetical protein
MEVARTILDLFAVLAVVFFVWSYLVKPKVFKRFEVLEPDDVDSTVKETEDPTDIPAPKICPFCREIVGIDKKRFVEHVRTNGKICAGSLMTPTAARFVARRNSRGLNGSEQTPNRGGSAGEDDRGEVPEGGTDPTDED